MATHPVFAEDLREIVESFVIESHEIFDELDNDLLALEQNADDPALVDQIFRAVHTVKGTSGFLSLEQLSILAHHFENVLNRLRKRTIDLKPGAMDVVFKAFDLMKVLLQQVIDGMLVPLDLTSVIADLDALAAGTFTTPTADPSEAAPALPDAAPALPEPGQEAVPAEQPAKDSARRPDRATETIRVEVHRLDNLMDLVGELVLSRNRLLQLVSDLSTNAKTDELLQELIATNTQVDFITTELQAAVMHTRMVQIGRVFNKFPRVIRDLAKEFDKIINLDIEGQDTEVDKSVIEEISDPLVHLIRNAADHGIEPPDVRLAAGKPAAGRILLSAAHEGNQIIITIEDDGAGLNPEKLKAKAIERNLITAREAAEMAEKEVFSLIFLPGFSTAEQVSQVSGRGVGMDVVKTNITRLSGTISVDTVLGKGSKFQLKLPLTLAIIQSLQVRVAEETFAVPLHTVVEVVGLQPDDIQTIRGREVIRLREQVLPLIRIGTALGTRQPEKPSSRAYAVIVGVAHHRLGLIVDGLVGQKEIVIKPLGSFLRKTRGIAGSTIMGDGHVVMILDIAELLRMENDKLHARSLPREAA